MNEFENTFRDNRQMVLVDHIVRNFFYQLLYGPPAQPDQASISKDKLLMILVVSLNELFLISLEQYFLRLSYI